MTNDERSPRSEARKLPRRAVWIWSFATLSDLVIRHPSFRRPFPRMVGGFGSRRAAAGAEAACPGVLSAAAVAFTVGARSAGAGGGLRNGAGHPGPPN